MSRDMVPHPGPHTVPATGATARPTIPRDAEGSRAVGHDIVLALDNAPLTRRHKVFIAALLAALIFDYMKPFTISFVIPGIRAQWGLSRRAGRHSVFRCHWRHRWLLLRSQSPLLARRPEVWRWSGSVNSQRVAARGALLFAPHTARHLGPGIQRCVYGAELYQPVSSRQSLLRELAPVDRLLDPHDALGPVFGHFPTGLDHQLIGANPRARRLGHQCQCGAVRERGGEEVVG